MANDFSFVSQTSCESRRTLYFSGEIKASDLIFLFRKNVEKRWLYSSIRRWLLLAGTIRRIWNLLGPGKSKVIFYFRCYMNDNIFN